METLLQKRERVRKRVADALIMAKPYEILLACRVPETRPWYLGGTFWFNIRKQNNEGIAEYKKIAELIGLKIEFKEKAYDCEGQELYSYYSVHLPEHQYELLQEFWDKKRELRAAGK